MKKINENQEKYENLQKENEKLNQQFTLQNNEKLSLQEECFSIEKNFELFKEQKTNEIQQLKIEIQQKSIF